jgi:hypothetical protein
MALKDMLKSPLEVKSPAPGDTRVVRYWMPARSCKGSVNRYSAEPSQRVHLITPMHRHERNDERALDECRQRVHVEAAHPKLDAPLLRGADVPG